MCDKGHKEICDDCREKLRVVDDAMMRELERVRRHMEVCDIVPSAEDRAKWETQARLDDTTSQPPVMAPGVPCACGAPPGLSCNKAECASLSKEF